MAILSGYGLLLLALAYPCLSLTDFQKSFTRKVSAPVVNPGCKLPQCTGATLVGNASNIVYVKAEGLEDDLHYLFSTMGPPTLIISRMHVGAELSIDWNQTFTPGVVPAPTIQYWLGGKQITPDRSFGIIFTRLYEFNDSLDQADITQIPADKSNWMVHKLSNFNWSFASMSGDEVILTSTLTVNSTFTFKVRTYGSDGRSDYSPHLEYTANSTEINVELWNISVSTANSRFALEMAIYDTGDSNTWQDATSVTTQQSLDDEYSPGVFQLISWQTNQTQDPLPGGGYAQWKPVCYVKPTMTRGDLTRATLSPLMTANSNNTWWTVVADIGLVDYFFGTYAAANLSINATNITLGYSGDGFYTSTNYTIWTVSVGMGAAPSDEVSFLVIIVIAIGLGIPVVLITIGGILLGIKRRRERLRSVYTPINEE